MTDTVIVVHRDTERWEIARNGDTKVSGDLQVRGKVTIMYQMKAGSMKVKAKKGKKK